MSAGSAGAPADPVAAEVESLKMQVGWLQSRVAAVAPTAADAEFKVFSQFGEDGLIQHLVRRVPIAEDVFVEFGVQDYSESNTRFLLSQDNWRGLIIDASADHREFLRRTGLGWRHQIDAVSAFIDRDNINGLISGAGIEGDIGLLSIDLDGNDLWVLEAIEVVSPRILIVEYNSVFGPEAAISVPYDPGFARSQANPSWLYWGASIAAVARVAGDKGFALVAGNRAGNNAFFVRRDVLGELTELTPSEAYVPSLFRESRGADGELTLVSSHQDRLTLIGEELVHDLDTGREITIAQRLGPR